MASLTEYLKESVKQTTDVLSLQTLHLNVDTNSWSLTSVVIFYSYINSLLPRDRCMKPNPGGRSPDRGVRGHKWVRKISVNPTDLYGVLIIGVLI